MTTRELPPVRPKRPPCPDRMEGVAAYRDAMDLWRMLAAAFDEAEDARAIAAGQAVYDLMTAAEARYTIDVASGNLLAVRGKISITLDDFNDWRAWSEAYGIGLFSLDGAMEFDWFRGAVLVVVR